MHALINAPKSISVPGTTESETVSALPPATTEMSGLMMFVVSSVTIDVNAPADDNSNSKIHNVAAVDEIFEFAQELHHGGCLSSGAIKPAQPKLPSICCQADIRRTHAKRSNFTKATGYAEWMWL